MMTTSEDARSVAIPSTWGGFPRLLTWATAAFVGVLALSITALVTGWPWAILPLMCTAWWVWAAGYWLGRAEGYIWVIVATVVGSAATGAAGLWWYIPVVVAATIATSVLGFRRLKPRVNLARKIAWVGTGLHAATNDDRPIDEILTPTWNEKHGSPISWKYPPHITPDPKKILEFERIIGERLGAPVDIQWKPENAIISLKKKSENTSDPVVERLNTVLSSLIPGAEVTTLKKDMLGVPELVEFTWPASSVTRASSPGFQGRVARNLQAATGQSLTVKFDTTEDIGTAVKLKPLPDIIDHPSRDKKNPMKIAFGQFRDGRECIWDLDAELPHVLIVGSAGGGKTVLLLSILTGLPEEVEIWPIDPKRIGLYNLHLLPNSRKPATREKEIVDRLLKVKSIMDERLDYLDANGPELRSTLKPIVLVIDEGEEMFDMLTAWWKSGDGKDDWMERFGLEKKPTGTTHPVMETLGSIARMGREPRVHIVLASQQASAEWLKTSSRAQFAVRIALKNLEPSTSVMHFGTPIATRGLENKPGRAWVSPALGVPPEHAQIFWTPKISAGLSMSDRAILHRLGVRLPDDPPVKNVFTHPQVEVASGDAVQSVPTVASPGIDPMMEIGAEDADAEEVQEFPETVDAEVVNLEDGTQILIDHDGVQMIAVVEGIEGDAMDPDLLELNYQTVDGEQGTIGGLGDHDTIPVVVTG